MTTTKTKAGAAPARADAASLGGDRDTDGVVTALHPSARGESPLTESDRKPSQAPRAPAPEGTEDVSGKTGGGDGGNGGEAPAGPVKKNGKAKRVLLAVVLLGLAAGGYEGYHWWTHGRFVESTDDAYVDADITVILSKVSGYVASLETGDNVEVKAGDVLFTIDDGDYRLAVQSARDSVASAKAAVERIGEQIVAGQASVREAEAGVAAAKAQREDATLSRDRLAKLTTNKVVSQSQLDTARTELLAAQANVDKAAASVDLAKANVAVLQGQKKEAEQSVRAAETALQKAERDLAFTKVRAPVSGMVGNRAAQVGSFVQAGSRMAAVVPLSSAYLEANFKETQLGRISTGARVSFTVDAYPDVTMHGRVESISPATGAVFSLLPPENATGNFTKVVQRVPVKIAVDKDDAAAHPLRAGMSVVVEVDTRTGGAGADAAHN
ncbi:HlyD family secretion protein [Stappia sp.]|uniref:HlyD family secretion protein n=1 Tax=Stappia sp. TaxID=1870903 RepID=UPI0025D003A6|nr:HlyD family secretion protein [Stappia sp.]